MSVEQHEIKLTNGQTRVVHVELDDRLTQEQKAESRKAQLEDAVARLGGAAQ